MQQYRVNYPLLIGMAIGMFITSLAVYGVWSVQIKRRSVALVDEAQKAYETGDYKDATQFLAQYLSIQPKDKGQRIKWAQWYADLAEQVDTDIEDRQRAVAVMEMTLREYPDEKVLRRRLAEFYGNNRVYQDALSHIKFLLDDPEARALQANYLFQSQDIEKAIPNAYALIGYDPDEDKFDDSKSTDPNVYLSLAIVLRSQKDRADLADRVIDQAVKANPNSAKAYLARGRYFIAYQETGRGRADIEKAYALSPEDADVLLANEELAVQNKEYDKARQYVESGKKLFPKDARFFQVGALLAMAQQDYAGALQEIDKGLRTLPSSGARYLLDVRANLQFQSDDFKGVRETMLQMEDAAYPPQALDWYEAKCLIGERKWFQANELLNKLRPWAETNPIVYSEYFYWLGFTYEQSGLRELARRAYDAVLERNPKHDAALTGKQRLAPYLANDPGMTESDALTRMIGIELKKPKADRKWADVEKEMDRIAEERGLDEIEQKLFRGRLLLAREDFAAARALAAELYKQDSKNVQIPIFVIQVVRFDKSPGQGPAGALQMMERMDVEDQAVWRLAKAELLTATTDESAKSQLANLLDGIDGWDDQQKLTLWSGMADRFLGVGMIEEARNCLTLLAEKQPDDLKARMRLFAIALDNNDDEAMNAAEAQILKIVGSKDDANWLYAEARRRLSQMRRGREKIENLGEVRKLIAQALEERPEWHDLYLLNAEIELLANNSKLALENLDRARELGRLAPVAIARHIQLLAQDGQFTRAAEMLEDVPENLRQPLLGDFYTELLFVTDKIDDAVKTARESAEANPKDPQLQYRYGQLLARSSERPGVSPEQKKATLEQAIQAIDQAVKLQPNFPDGWYSLILFNAMAKHPDRAQAALRDAQLSLAVDDQQFILAKCYEALSDWFDAEAMYRAMYDADPSDVNRVQQLAAFYIGPGYRQADLRDKAAPLINQILKAGAAKEIPPNHKQLLWARRAGAKLLASTGDYQQLLKAEKMLASNSQDGSLPLEDRLQMAQLLASRPEPESRLKAAGLLREIDKVQRLNEDNSLILGNLYFRLGEWENCKQQMSTAISRFSNSARLRQTYANMLISRGTQKTLKDAEVQIRELRTLAPNDPTTFDLAARLAIKANQKDAIQRALVAQVGPVLKNPNPQSVSQADANRLEMYASFFTELKDLDQAEAIYRFLAKRDPSDVFKLANFLGTHRDVEQCFDLLDAQYNDTTVPAILQASVNVVRKRRDEIGNRFDARVEGWLDRALQSNFGSVPLLMAKAEFREVQQKYDDAINIYRELLANPDVAGVQRAVVLNNLSYLVALADANAAGSGVDPLKLVQEAISILGPTAEILDTRATVLISRKRYDEAIDDLGLSLTDSPTAAKYFHKATAHLLKGQNSAALEAWSKAEELGLTRDSLNLLEHDRYQQMQSKIEQLRAGSASVTRTEAAAAK
jgi:tetratricopeptide (TPR) repeat protein